MSNQDYYGASGGGNTHQPGQFYSQPPSQNPNSYVNYEQQQPPYPHEPQHGHQSQSPHSYGQSSTYEPRTGNHPQEYQSQPPYGDNRGHHSPYPHHDGNNQNYEPHHSSGGPQGPGEQDERGLGATLVGGASGGFIAHKAGGGLVGSVLGSVVGAVGANILEHKLEGKHHKKDKKHKKEKKEKKHKKHGSKDRGFDSGSSSSSDSD